MSVPHWICPLPPTNQLTSDSLLINMSSSWLPWQNRRNTYTYQNSSHFDVETTFILHQICIFFTFCSTSPHFSLFPDLFWSIRFSIEMQYFSCSVFSCWNRFTLYLICVYWDSCHVWNAINCLARINIPIETLFVISFYSIIGKL